MPKNISGSSQTSMDLTAEVPLAGDISSAARFEGTIQGLLNNDATLSGRFTGAYIQGLLDGLGLIDRGEIADNAINNEKLAAGTGTVGEFLQLRASNGLGWATPLQVRTGNGLTQVGTGNDGTVTIQIGADAITNAMIAANAVRASEIQDAAVTRSKLAAGTAASGNVLEATASGMQWATPSPAPVTFGDWSPAANTQTASVMNVVPSASSYIQLGKLVLLQGFVDVQTQGGRSWNRHVAAYFPLPVNRDTTLTQDQDGVAHSSSRNSYPLSLIIRLRRGGNPPHQTIQIEVVKDRSTTDNVNFTFFLAYVAA